MPELAFAGDINGDLWMFKLDKTNYPGSSTAYKVFDGSPNQPITNTPAIVEHPRIRIHGLFRYWQCVQRNRCG